MCGIAGYISTSRKHDAAINGERIFKPIVRRGLRRYAYKSPQGTYLYARLPTDAVSGNFPQQLVERKFLYNGILYGIDVLGTAFNIPKNILHSDSLVLEYGFRRYGKKFLRHLRGMFAFAMEKDGTVYLVRDTIGIKPLYYIRENGYFAFASEMKSLARLQPRRIYEVDPGTIVVFDIKRGTVHTERFTYRPQSLVYSNISMLKSLETSLIGPTKRYLAQNKDIRIAVCLSGGLDSSILLALLKRYLTVAEFGRLEAFTVSTEDSEDGYFAEKLAKRYGIRINLIRPYSEKRSITLLPDMVYRTESPYVRVTKVALLQDALAAAVQKKGIRVLISGEGADELFYGYKKFIVGLEPKEIDHAYRSFFEKAFHKTLLQRLDRVFAQRQIEGRVPFLDQEIVAKARNLSVHRKVQVVGDTLITKKALRDFARYIGLPTYIINRSKVSMTKGATSHENSDLFARTIQKRYLELFSYKGRDILDGDVSINLRELELRNFK